MLESADSEDHRIISREIIFEVFIIISMSRTDNLPWHHGATAQHRAVITACSEQLNRLSHDCQVITVCCHFAFCSEHPEGKGHFRRKPPIIMANVTDKIYETTCKPAIRFFPTADCVSAQSEMLAAVATTDLTVGG